MKKGTWNIAGDLSLNLRNDDDNNNSTDYDNNTFNFSIAPKIGYALNDNLILGLGLSYNYSKYDREIINESNTNTIFSKSNSYGILAYAKKFLPVSKKLALHLAAETGFSRGNSNSENTNTDFNSDTRRENFSIIIRPGINYRLTNKFLVHANFGSLGYNNINEEFNASDKPNTENRNSNSFGFNFSTSSLYFGFTVLL
ncbi:outer membrane beta-barrel protein [Sediminibacter sp. Hel_I_10]|uniref:outer membrane beta-barrel protein n=1 Tax=Sediminibacter sp. Hel_I_10 TaxID=1392490 RepID=UPI000478EFAC|nr:outer membrane beta-barrel protein [Sediminibacter sp. Hel_I_10]